MRKILKGHFILYLDIIEALFHSSEPLPLDVIAQKVRRSPRRVSDLIFEINHTFDCIRINHLSDQYYEIHCSSKKYGIDALFHHIYKCTPIFKILEKIFFEPMILTDTIVDDFFISRPTLYRLLRRVKKITEKDFDFSISNTPYEYIGDESNIRFFLTAMFMEKYSVIDWPFEKIISEARIHQWIEIFNEFLPVPIERLDYLFLKYYFAVSYVRHLQKYKLHFVPSDRKLHKKARQTYSMMQQRIRQTTHMRIPLHLLYELMPVSLFVLDFSKRDRNYDQIRTTFQPLLDDMAETFELSLSNADEIYFAIFWQCYLSQGNLEQYYIIHNREKYPYLSFKWRYPDFSHVLYTKIVDLLSEKNMPYKDTVYYLFNIIVRNWENLTEQLNQSIRPLKILIINHNGRIHVPRVKEQLRFWFADKIVITVTENDYLIGSVSNKYKDYDLILANYSVSSKLKVPIIYIDEVLTKYQLGDIFQFLEKKLF